MYDIQYNVDIKRYITFGISAEVGALAVYRNVDDLKSLLALPELKGKRFLNLGSGSNMLFTERFDGVVLHSQISNIEIVGQDDFNVFVRVGAGVIWDDFVDWAVDQSYYGVENLSAIPGTVGASAVQNIGAYGAEAKDTITRVEIFRPEHGDFATLAAEECGFGYRDSIFKRSLKGRVIITAVEFRLSKTARPNLGYGDVVREVEARGGATLRNIRDAICSIRRSKLPDTAVTGNAGSFFKNPVVDTAVAERLKAQYSDMPLYPAADGTKAKLAAGWLIDKAGLKGYSEGRVGVHSRQALVLINLGGATGGEVIGFARSVQAKVRERFGIDIETEVNIL